ncbi:hypothetical protein NL321_27885, partial [Klebsiella pneumoniae]|nr:hypothetical protein [Klebsiella pneumoniae]
LSYQTLSQLGILRCFRILGSYLRRPGADRPVLNLEDFFVQRFGRELYRLFFESYTEKVWGVPCRKIKPDWGAQRIKGLSITEALASALTKAL